MKGCNYCSPISIVVKALSYFELEICALNIHNCYIITGLLNVKVCQETPQR